MDLECRADWDAHLFEAAAIGRVTARRLARPPRPERFASLRYRRRDAFGGAVDGGTGACMFRKRAGSWSQGFFSWSACHGYSPFIGMQGARPRQVPMCPRSVPVALVVAHKAGTTSAIHWAASLDEVAPQVVRLLAELTDCVCADAGSTHASMGVDEEANASMAHGIALELVRPWLHYLDSVPPDQARAVDYGLMPLLGSCQDIWLPSMYCPTCCVPGLHPRRMHLALVRNPFRRFASAYAWLRGDPERFPYFVELFHGLWRQSGGKLLANPNTLPNATLHFPFDWGAGYGPKRPWLRAVEVFHFRAAHRELRDAFASVSLRRHNYTIGETGGAPLGLAVRIVHLETLDEEWPEVLRELCQEHDYCSPLSSLPALNVKGRSRWRETWGPRTARLVREMLDEDFHAFGYGDSPQNPEPLRPGVLDFKF